MDPSSSEDDGQSESGQQAINEAEAYNQNIYIMVGLPYGMLLLFGFLIYRGVRQNEAYRRARGQLALAGPVDGLSATPAPSRRSDHSSPT